MYLGIGFFYKRCLIRSLSLQVCQPCLYPIQFRLHLPLRSFGWCLHPGLRQPVVVCLQTGQLLFDLGRVERVPVSLHQVGNGIIIGLELSLRMLPTMGIECFPIVFQQVDTKMFKPFPEPLPCSMFLFLESGRCIIREDVGYRL
jgi:hypothetical protein